MADNPRPTSSNGSKKTKEKKPTPKAIKLLRIIAPIIGLSVALIIAPIDLLPPTLLPLPNSIEEQLEEGVDLGLDGIMLYVQKGNETPRFYTEGVKNKATGEPADAQALFKIASIHKLFIASSVAKLSAEGILPVDALLSDLLPELSGRIENSDTITVRMLVQHRSGIPNYSDQEGFDWFAPAGERPVDAELELLLDKPADFSPDSRYQYSNSNYLLLGLIMNRILGYDHQEFVNTRIMAPLGLENTYWSISEVDFDDVASGYWFEYEDDFRNLDGSMISSLEDVGVLIRALNDGSLFTEREAEIYAGLYEYGHTGWVPGYYSIARYHQESDTVMVQFVNTTGGATWGTANVIGGKATAFSNIVYNRLLRILDRS